MNAHSDSSVFIIYCGKILSCQEQGIKYWLRLENSTFIIYILSLVNLGGNVCTGSLPEQFWDNLFIVVQGSNVEHRAALEDSNNDHTFGITMESNQGYWF